MKATTVKVYKNARGNDLRNALKINRLLSSFLSILGIHRNKIFAFHTSSSAYYLTRSPSSVECSRLNKMKKLIITKVEIDRPFLKLVCFVSSILTTCSKWEHKTHKLDLWEKSLCKKMLTWSYHYHFCRWLVSLSSYWCKTGVKTSEARENKQKNPLLHRWWQTLKPTKSSTSFLLLSL